MTEPCDLDATGARALIGAKRLSATELLDSCIARIETVDHAVNAMVARDFDRARAAARAADERTAKGEELPPLHGLPIAVKDLEDVGGLRTTYGSEIFAAHVPTADQLIVCKVKAAGAIVVGKSNTPEWGAGANTRNAVYGVTGNAFDPTRSAAGSSGGSAVALATNMVPIATGSDTGGSLRNPAAFNGIVGYRPTPGLVPNEKARHGWNPLSVLGPMARTVQDASLLLAGMIGDDGLDPLATTIAGRQIRKASEFAQLAPADLAGVKAAFTADFGFAPVEAVVADAFSEKIGLCRKAFARAEDATPDCAGMDGAFAVLRAVGMLAGLHEVVQKHPGRVGPNVTANVQEGLGYSALDVARALTAQTQIYRRWQEFFTRHDVILTPAITISPRDWHELYPRAIDGKQTQSYFHWLALAYAVSTVGHPAISLPVGRDAKGMPFGLQIVGRRGGDAAVLRVALALETLFADDVRTARPEPDIAKLQAARPIAEMPGFMGFGEG